MLGLTREYAKFGMYEKTDYRVEVSYRIYMKDYKVRLVIYEAR